jgi:hypothetical protein
MSLLLTDNNQSIQVRDGTTHAVLASAPLATTTAVQITGSASATTSLTVAEDAHLNVLPISFAGQTAGDALTVTDHTGLKGEVYTLNTGVVALSTGGQVSWSNTANIIVNGNGGGNTFNVQGTDLGAAFILNTGSGQNAVNVGDAANTLHGIEGTLTVNAIRGTTVLTFNSQGSAVGPSSQGATWYADHVVFNTDGPTPETIYFSNVKQLVENASAIEPSWGDLFYYSIPSLHLTLNNAYGNGVLYPLVGLGQKQTITISGHDAGTINNNITFNGYGLLYAEGQGTTVYKFLPNSSQIAAYVDHVSQGNGTGILDFSALTQAITVNLQSSTVADSASAAAIAGFQGINEIIGGTGSNTVVGGAGDTSWAIYGHDQFQASSITFQHFDNLVGSSGANTFAFSASGGLDGSIVGGGGTNTLDFSFFVGNIIVDLPLGLASQVFGSIANIQNVVGSIGNDILVGNGGNTLTGGTGRNFLIAGSTPSTLIGQAGEDILVGGTTAYDTNLPALGAIMSEWTRTDLFYSDRVNHLLNGGGKNGSTVLNTSTFSTNGGHNTLNGGPGLDLFYGFRTLETTDYNPGIGEIFINDATFGHTRIDTSKLSLPQVELDTTQLLPPGVTPYLTLTPGTHTLIDVFTGNNVQFTVAIDGTVDYAPSLNSVLAGRGTTTLIVHGATVTVDATPLSLPSVSVNAGEFIENTNNPFTLSLLPGRAFLSDIFTGNTVQFNVANDGTVSYDPSLNGVFLPGPTSSTLVVHGATVTVDATKLGVTTPTLYVNGGELIEQNNAAFTLNLLPGRAFLSDPLTNALVQFSIANDATISYDPTLEGILTGAGTSALTVHGVTLNVDATALSQQDPTFSLDGVGSFSTAQVQSFQVLPGGSNTFQAGSTQMQFSIDVMDQLSFAAIYDAIAKGRGTNTLTLV